LAPYDAYATDLPLRDALRREGGGWAEPEVAAYGPIAGGELMELGVLANENKPKFRPYDRYGHRTDFIEFHPSYHRIMELGIEYGVPNFAWRHEDRAGAHVARAALAYLHNQPEQGTSCPLTMTYACVPALRHQPDLVASWLPRVTSVEYDAQFIPAWQKAGNTIGMGMTEKQGGSDVRSNSTRAFPMGASGSGQLYELVGHKWFFSAPMCDAFLVLAQTDAGLSCFLLPRLEPGGRRNAIRINRLKDKLGNRSNASAEVEFERALAWPLGPPGRGIATILEMVQWTRLDCVIGSAGIIRAATAFALHHARHRTTFGRTLADHPLMTTVLADVALESEAALALAIHAARSGEMRAEATLRAAMRIVTPAAKYWVCKRAIAVTAEAMEALGGNGYVEEQPLPRLYREAPVNSIWEGSGNIVCLDVLRAMLREPEAADALRQWLGAARGANAHYDRHLDALDATLTARNADEAGARATAQAIALAVAAAELLRHAPSFVSDAYCASRLAPAVYAGAAFGMVRDSGATAKILSRGLPG